MVHTCVTPLLERLRQEGCKFEAILGNSLLRQVGASVVEHMLEALGSDPGTTRTHMHTCVHV